MRYLGKIKTCLLLLFVLFVASCMNEINEIICVKMTCKDNNSPQDVTMNKAFDILPYS